MPTPTMATRTQISCWTYVIVLVTLPFTSALIASTQRADVPSQKPAASLAHRMRYSRDLRVVLDSMQRLVAFFGKDYSSVNLDGLFGLRLGQGSVNQTIADCRSHSFHCPARLVQNLESLNHYIEYIGRHALPYVEAQDPDYFQKFLPTIDAPYILNQYHPETIVGDIYDTLGMREYDEEAGDVCLSMLMGTYENYPKCTVSEDCWAMMTQANTNGYPLTHQLVYFIIADKTGCVPSMAKRFQKMATNIQSQEKRICSRILTESKQLVHGGKVNLMKQDLFIEQLVLCGVLGFENFLRDDWMRVVLMWQNDEGCFGETPAMMAVENKILKLEKEEQLMLSLMKTEAEQIDKSTVGTGRKLLREHVMKGNCLAHKTGLGFGLVGAYIRHFVNKLYGPNGLM